MTYRKIPLVAVIFLSGCDEGGMDAFRGAPSTDWEMQVVFQCADALGERGALTESQGRACSKLDECMFDATRATALNLTTSWRTYDKIVPRKEVIDRQPFDMSVLGSRAEQAGPEARAMFATMVKIREQCLVETGLRELVSDS